MMFLSISAFAQKAILVDVVSENILKVKIDNEVKRVHLAGIDLFATANGTSGSVSMQAKQRLKETTIRYLKSNLNVGSHVEYSVIYLTDSGVQKIWLTSNELNYKIIRDGYALVDTKDEYLPYTLKKRMTIAMKYAQEKEYGLWKNKAELMALVDMKQHMCGWSKETSFLTDTKMRVLKKQQDSLPKSANVMGAQRLSLR